MVNVEKYRLLRGVSRVCSMLYSAVLSSWDHIFQIRSRGLALVGELGREHNFMQAKTSCLPAQMTGMDFSGDVISQAHRRVVISVQTPAAKTAVTLVSGPEVYVGETRYP
jgi:hypothetical protein